MKRYWSEKAAGLTPYVAGEQPKEKLIKLNTNENAYPPSPKVFAAIEGVAQNLRLYPNPSAQALRQTIAQTQGIAQQQVFCSNGSDEALALAFLAFFNPGEAIRTVDVTYSFYPVWAKLFDITLHSVPLKADFTVDVRGLCGGQGAVVANPNAPTGIALGLDSIEEIVAGTDGVVVVDEAYQAFGADSAIPLIKKYKNLAVVRTFSKSHSLAGLRVGYIAADENLIAALETVKDSFNSYTVDMLAQAGAAAALHDTAYYEETTKQIIADRESTRKALEAMGLLVLPSSANFLFVRCEDAVNVFAALRQYGILVRYFAGGRTADFLRVTIGTTAEMEAFVKAMRQIVGQA